VILNTSIARSDNIKGIKGVQKVSGIICSSQSGLLISAGKNGKRKQ
jgi:hypothetical protein